MVISLPQAKPGDTRLKKLAIGAYRWIAWFVPAFADSWDEDKGEPDEEIDSLLTILAIVFAVVLPILCYYAEIYVWWECLLFGIGVYLFLGALYHWHKSRSS